MGATRNTKCVSVLAVAEAILLFTFLAATTGAGTITVTNTNDSGPGTLRAALTSSANGDVINFSLNYPATITLTGGELLLTNNVTIAGPGAANLTISGNNGGRVFHVGTSNSPTISDLTIAGGAASAGGVGAGVYCDSATLQITNCVIRNNQVTGGSTGAGGGIYSNQSQLTLTGCTINANTASGNGGGIFNGAGSTLTVNNSAITGNSALSGGGLCNSSGTLAANRCLIYTNVATHGGGITNAGALGLASLFVNNCTLSSNVVSGASATGSQIVNVRQLSSASALISNSTIVSNNVAPTYSGGAIYNDNGAAITLGNTIILASLQEHTIINAGSGSTVMSAGYNLSFDGAGGFLIGPADQINTDPLLDLGTGPRDNGGPTSTIALQANSPAIDKGKRDAVASLAAATDQRGEPRPFNDPNIPNASGGDGSDIGAYEADLRVTGVSKVTNDLRLTFTSVVGKSYQLQKRSNLVSGDWIPVGSAMPGDGGIIPLSATGAFSQPGQFYRVLQTP